ncbi:hypothetical protein AB6A40_001206, partial [Gnathostoma spinigerum]
KLYTADYHCDEKPNGYYSMGCSSRYYGCSNGIETAFMCPNALKFNEHTGKCDYIENVPACKHRHHEFCAEKPDGVYAHGCSGRYAICANRKEYGYQCPIGYVFNERTAMCEEPSHVHGCAH